MLAAGVAAAAAVTTIPSAGFGARSVATTAAEALTAKKTTKRRSATPAEVKVALHRCGLNPRALAAAGVSAAATTTLVDNARQYLTDHPDDIGDADRGFLSAQAALDQLTRKVQSGQAGADDLTAYAATQQALAARASSRDAAINAVLTAAVANLSDGQQSLLSTIRANASWNLPLQYLVSTRTDAQWVELREALTNDRQAAAQRVAPDPRGRQTLIDANSLPATSTAVQNLADHLTDVTSAFNAAVTGR
jgi:hypothetical protein